MGMTYNYITSAQDDADLQFDVDALGDWLVEQKIVEYRTPPKVKFDGLATAYDRGLHSERLFNMDFSDRNDGETVAQRADGNAVFQWDLTIHKLPNPVALPFVTHRYPIYCPKCGSSCDQSFQEKWYDGFEKKEQYSFLKHGVDSNLVFNCPECSHSIAIGEVSQQGPMLLRRNFVELDDSCYHTDKVEFLSREARAFLEPLFGGSLAVRSGWVT